MKKTLLVLVAGLLACCTAVAQRLPGGASPDHYSLAVTINFPTNSYEGDETIDLKLSQPASSITLNAVDIDFHEVTVTAGGHTQTAKVSTDPKQEMATFTVDKQLPAGPASVHIKYTGHLNDKLRGFYLSTYKGRKYVVSQMESTDARVAFPCFDEPAYKATFDLTAIVDKGDTAISNGEIVSDTPGPGDRHTIRFSTSPKMSSYLVALTVGDWKCEYDKVDGVKVGVCAVPGKENLTHFPLEATKAILHYYDDYYGIKYPLPKLDNIAVPDFQAGAMENWGAIIYRETALLVDDKTASVGHKQGVAETIAHEMAHQWFGDLVTAAWWDDIWLNEGFATWMTPHPLAQWKPEWMVEQETVADSDRSMAGDSVKNTRPIHQPAETRAEIEQLFDGIAYGKSAAVLHMLESYLGPETFRNGVNLYLKEHAYGNATAADFWSTMARASKKPVDQIMPTFVLQPGVPFVEADAKCEGGNTRLTLLQKRYFDTREDFDRPDQQIWQVPVCAKGVNGTSAGNQQCFLLTQREQQFTLKGCSKFVFPDATGLGYYRFGYDSAALHQLGNAVETALTPEERIALMGNEWALMRIGKHSMGDYLALGAQLKNTPGADLLASFGQHLDFIDDHMLTDADRPEFQAWLRAQFSPVLQQLGYNARPNDTPEEKQKRAILFAGLGNLANDPEVIQQARVMVQQYMKDPASVDGTLAQAVVGVAARHGDAELYRQFRAQMQKAASPEQYYQFFYAQSEFTQPELTKETLDSTLTPAVRGQDLYILLPLLGNPASQDATWDFMRSHFDELSRKTGGGLGGVGIFMYGAQSFCSTQKAGEVKQFFQQHPFPGTEQKQKEAIESIDSCVELRDQQQANLSAWLKQQSNPTNASNAGALTTGAAVR
ncbi:MAG TPA: M1 family metallopeptidase [Candidatus Binatia bacterium]|nr:M1 family metallopeptidase [Candidatus Binatia bacterium]